MGVVRTLVGAINRVIPEVDRPTARPTLKERLGWTLAVLLVYYILASIPVYGVQPSQLDYLRELRIIFAGARGSIIDLGIGPIVTAGIILELLVGSKIIELDLTDPDNRKYFQQAQRVAALLFIVFENAAYVLGGSYGRLDVDTAVLVIAQLCLGSFVLMMLDDLVGKWGIGSGISLFILANVAQNVFWGIFSPATVRGQYVGVVPALALGGSSAIYRPNLPDLMGLIATFVVFLAVVWAYEVRVEIPIAHTLVGGQRVRYPIRLLYVSNIPIIFTQALYGDLRILANIVWTQAMAGNWLAQQVAPWLGVFDEANRVTGGILYYLTIPRDPSVLFTEPLRALAYLLLYVGFSVLFAKVWVITAGMDPDSVARQLIAQGMVIPGRRASPKLVADTIRGYIEAVTIVGGALVGLLAALADFSGAIGTGSGILLAVTIASSFYEIITRERALELYPRLSKILGV